MYNIDYAYYIHYALLSEKFTIMQIIRRMIIILSDNSPSSEIGTARFSPAQGSFRSVQLFGAGTYQVHGCPADILQPVSCKTVLRQPSTGPCHDSAAGIDNGAFVVSQETVWYARVLLLFLASAKTNTGSKSSDCALVSTMETFDDPENGYYMHYMHFMYYMSHMYYVY